MQPPHTPQPNYSEPDGSVTDNETAEVVVVFAWAVPTSAKVPAPRQGGPATVMTLRPASISTTVPAKVITELRANNTVLPTRWCTTATLTASSGRA